MMTVSTERDEDGRMRDVRSDSARLRAHFDVAASIRHLLDTYANAELVRRHERTEVMLKKAHDEFN